MRGASRNIINLKNKELTMKRLYLLLAAACALAACNSESGISVSNPDDSDSVVVRMDFQPYDITIEPMTRAQAVSDFCSRLDIWVTDGSTTTDIHQASTDTGFGSAELTLNKHKTYTLYCTGHKADGPATLTNGIIAWPDDKVTHSFFYTTQFSPASTSSLECVMNRIVAQFRLEIADVVPDDVAKFTYSIPQTYNRFNVSGAGANQVDRTGTINLTSRNQDGTATINIYIIPTSATAQDEVDITVQALTSADVLVQQQSFGDVPIHAGYRTIFHGNFFTDKQFSVDFQALDWQELDTVSF